MTNYVEAMARHMHGEERAMMQHFFSELQNQDSISEEMRDMLLELLQEMPENRMRKIDFSKVSEKYWSTVFEWVTGTAEVLDLDQFPEWLNKYT
jgi:hypothetical protein